MTSQQPNNTSGMGAGHDVPLEIRGRWNWGAFFFTFLWGMANNTYVALAALIPGLNFVVSVILGAKGSEWAWQNRRFEGGIAQYRRVQRAWALWGWGIAIIVLGPIILTYVLMTAALHDVGKASDSAAPAATRPPEAYSNVVKLYDVTAGYEDHVLDGKTAVVRGKVKNIGDQSLSRVEVTAYFLDEDGNRIHEDDYSPVWSDPSSFVRFGDDRDNPLKPGYIRTFGFRAKGCPTEWKTGRIQCEITDLEFEEEEE